jgi:hypothetical protein
LIGLHKLIFYPSKFVLNALVLNTMQRRDGKEGNSTSRDVNSGLSVGGFIGNEGAPMVVKVIVPASRKVSSIEADSGILWDPDSTQIDLVQALRRFSALGGKQKFLAGGTKAATPVVKALLHVIKTRSQVRALHGSADVDYRQLD